MRSKEEILNDFKACCCIDGDCKRCSYYISGVCSDDEYNELEREVIELLESDVDYNKGMEDAWELMKEIYGMSSSEIYQCFSNANTFWDILRNYTILEVKTEIKEFKRNNFYVGDIVYNRTIKDKDVCGIIVNIDRDWLEVLTNNREIEQCLKEDMKKTGKHLDIDSLFKQIEELSV